MKVSISVEAILFAIIIVLIFYILRNGRPTFSQGFGREPFGVLPGTTCAFSAGTAWREPFGVSPGTLTQLAANHVTTAEDIPMLKQWIKERQQGIWQMTESDLVGKAPMEYSILGSRIGAFT